MVKTWWSCRINFTRPKTQYGTVSPRQRAVAVYGTTRWWGGRETAKNDPMYSGGAAGGDNTGENLLAINLRQVGEGQCRVQRRRNNGRHGGVGGWGE